MSGEDVWKRIEIDSPCVAICVIQPETRLCLGCSRTADEISRWSRMTSEERTEIMSVLPERDPGPMRRRGGVNARRAARRNR